MNYRLPDEEYAVLSYIRSRGGTHIDHLKIVFGPAAVPAVDHLYQYGLIDPDFPNTDIYTASDLGHAYRHEEPYPLEVDEKKDTYDSTDDRTDVIPKQKFFKNPLFWTIFGTLSTIFIGLAGIIVAIVIANVFR